MQLIRFLLNWLQADNCECTDELCYCHVQLQLEHRASAVTGCMIDPPTWDVPNW
jgi:hypothetical protein